MIILTAHDSLHNAIESSNAARLPFYQQTVCAGGTSEPHEALEKQFLLREAEKLREKLKNNMEKRLEVAEARPAPIFKSKPMQEIEELIEAMLPSDANVSLQAKAAWARK